MIRLKSFLSDIRVEMHKVTWPGRKETIATTWLVLAIIVLISFYLGLCDLILAKIIKAMLH